MPRQRHVGSLYFLRTRRQVINQFMYLLIQREQNNHQSHLYHHKEEGDQQERTPEVLPVVVHG